MTNLPERVAETALEDLTDRAILISDLESRTFYLPPLAAQFIKTHSPKAVIKTGDIFMFHAYEYAMKCGSVTNDMEKYSALEYEWDFLFSALPLLLKGDNDRLQKFYSQIDRFLDFTGKWDDIILIASAAEKRAIVANDMENAGLRAYQVGWIYYLRNQPEEVLEYATRAVEHWRESSLRNKADVIRLRGHGFTLTENWDFALNAYQEALEIYRLMDSESDDVANALNSLANIQCENKEYDIAECNYLEALRIAKNNDYNEGLAVYTGNLSELAFTREQWVRAECLARQALGQAEIVGRKELIAGTCLQVAKAQLKQKQNLLEAKTLAMRAVQICLHINMPRELLGAQQIVEEIEQAISGE